MVDGEHVPETLGGKSERGIARAASEQRVHDISGVESADLDPPSTMATQPLRDQRPALRRSDPRQDGESVSRLADGADRRTSLVAVSICAVGLRPEGFVGSDPHALSQRSPVAGVLCLAEGVSH